jgi:cytochrome P450 / NADPH-cytochrome P450 reductase
LIIVTASYEGQPADNAAQFFDWLLHLPKSETTKNIRYAVFGCGNHDWATTYQRIPTIVDNLLEEHGASRVIPRGEGDSSQGNFFQVFEDFQKKLWETLSKVKKDAS